MLKNEHSQKEKSLQASDTSNEIEKLEKSVKNWNRSAKVSAVVCGASLGAALWTGLNESKEDDFLAPIAVVSTLASAGMTGASLAKKDEKEVLAGKPSTLWPKVAKGSALLGLLSLGAALLAGFTEYEGDDLIVPVGGALGIVSSVVFGFSCAKASSKKSILKFSKSALSSFKRKNKAGTKDFSPVLKKMLKSGTIIWQETVSQKPLTKDMAKTLKNKMSPLDPFQVVKSNIPQMYCFGSEHVRG